MIRLTVIVSLIVTILQYLGVVGWLSEVLTPVFKFIGLPGEASLVFISGFFVNIYSAVAVVATLDLSVRAITILAVMGLCAHNMIVETAVQKKTGSSAVRMVLLRTLSAFILGYLLHLIMPESSAMVAAEDAVPADAGWGQVLLLWLKSTAMLILKMGVLILSLNIIQRILGEFGVIRWLSKLFRPILKVFGLPARTSFLWIIANTLGLAYGSAVMIEECEQGKISKEDADLLNHHIAISHSNLEDVLLFVSVGGLVWWILLSRWIWAAVVVWVRRLELLVRK